jgi:hypothetical protein
MSVAGVSKSELTQKLGRANSGECIIYHVGFLMNDRLRDRKLHNLAGAVWAAYAAGQIRELKQRKLGPMSYEYLAVKA